MKRYTVKEYAHKMKVSRMTVYRMIKKKKLPDGTKAKVFLTHIYIETE